MSSIQWNNRTSALEVCQYFKHEIQGRVILITGPTITGVGYATALAIAKAEPKRLILAGRSVGKLEESRDAILRECPGAQLKLLTLDLGDLEAVRQSAKEVLGWEEPIDALIHNAAVLTLLLLPNILSSHSKRIVNVSSAGHGNGSIRFKDPDFKDEEYNRKEAYGQSKTGMILVARQLARLYASKGLTAFSLDPGGISTPLQQHWSLEEKQDIGRKYGAYHEDGTVNTDCQVWKTTDQGASTTCRAAFDPDLVNGSYLVDAEVAEDKCKDYAKDMELAEKTWGWLEGLVGQKAE